MRFRLVLGGLIGLSSLIPIVASADVPYPTSSGQADPYAYQNYDWQGAPGTGTTTADCNAASPKVPAGFDCSNYKFSSKVDPTVEPGVPTSQELGDVMGPSVDTAWDVTTGRPDVHVAVLDSGIEWNSYGDMQQLRNKVVLDWAELPPPQDSAASSPCDSVTVPPRTQKLTSPGFPRCYDLNHDGVFNIEDYSSDPRVNPPGHTLFCCAGSGHTLLTPEDLIEVFSCWNASTDPRGTSLGTLIVGGDGTTTCSNGTYGVDNDANGFAHDIAGWNFMEHTNDPFDEPNYSHGTGEAEDSNGETNIGREPGTCASCMVMPLKVGDSFIADVNDFAQAVLYATDNQVQVVQEALGTINNSSLNQAAIDYAWNHGVTVIASAADEAAGHHNQPASSENHTVVVNSLRLDDLHAEAGNVPQQFQPLVPTTGKTYLSLNGCTNYGGHIDISIPSVSCSSEATGKSSGMAGLVISEARNLVAEGLMTPYAPPSAAFPDGVAISPDEVKQVLTMTADDVDFEDPSPPVPRASSPADHTSPCSRVTGETPGPPDNYASGNAGSRYFSIGGWDQYYGYGRVNVNCAVRAVMAGALPPVVDITSPRWWANLDPTGGTYQVQGSVAAPRAQSYAYKVQIAYGVQPHESDWTTVYTSPTQTDAINGTLATINASQIAAIMPAVPGVTPACGTRSVDPNGDQPDWQKPPYTTVPGSCQNYWDEYTFSIRVQATDDKQRTGEDRRTLQAQHDTGDPATNNGAPNPTLTRTVADQFGYATDGDSPPLMADLLGDNQNELVFATSNGEVHALRANGQELPGFPVHSTPLCDSQPPDATSACSQRAHEPAFSDPTVGAVAQHADAAVLGSVAVGDLDHTGKQELVFGDLDGYIYVYEMSSSYCTSLGAAAPCLRPGFPVHNSFAFSRQGAPPNYNRDHDNRVQFGFIASPTLANLDVNTAGDQHKLEIIAGGLDRHVYVFQPDGSMRAGFPVLLQAPEYVSSVDPGTDRIHYKQSIPYGTKIVSSPAVADLLGDGHLEIVVGRNEEYNASGSSDGGLNASADTYNPTLAELGTNSGLFHSGNGRVYALYADGAGHAQQGCNAPGNGVPTNAYVCGWPVRVVKFDMELLPYVGSGVDTPPAVMPQADLPCPGDSAPGDRVGVFTSDGPAYIFAGDGKSCYGQAPNVNGQTADRVLGNTTEQGNSSDTPYLEAVGDAAFGDLTGTGDYVVAAPTAGIVRAADLVLTDHQYNGEDDITAWSVINAPGGAGSPAVPQPHAGFPHFMNDLQFLAGPAIADLSGTGTQEVLAGSAVSDFRAVTPAGVELPGWAKNTNGWIVMTPAVGPIGAEQTQQVAVLTREGSLFVWRTAAPACSGASWPRYKHDDWNSGNFTTDALRPATITDLSESESGSTVTLSFTAPHADLFCGNAAGYQIRYSATAPISDATWSQATVAAPGNAGGCTYTPQPAKTAGTRETIVLTGCPAGQLYFDVQAFNASSETRGNLAAVSRSTPSADVPEIAFPASLLLGGFALVAARARRRRRGRHEAPAGLEVVRSQD
ncbi:MAG: hypothetical protein ABR498_09145 [Candidatus Dormibacteria bacterium]